MEAKAVARYVPIGPRKARLVIDLVRNLGINEALATLKFTKKAAAKPIEKLLKSALANAGNNSKVDVDKLYVKKIHADDGPSLKRFRPRAMGRATQILKRSCHITVVLGEKETSDSGKKNKKKKKSKN